MLDTLSETRSNVPVSIFAPHFPGVEDLYASDLRLTLSGMLVLAGQS
jgi:hypothetical protein